VGVIITDSHTASLGSDRIRIACRGFEPLRRYVAATEVSWRKLVYTKVNVADALAAAAVLAIGEGNGQTPLAVAGDVGFVAFRQRWTSPEDVQGMRIDLDADLYGPLLRRETWRTGGE
jgi:F420-0:gamma-glutamyl ligase